jgi:hypothetical protein
MSSARKTSPSCMPEKPFQHERKEEAYCSDSTSGYEKGLQITGTDI